MSSLLFRLRCLPRVQSPMGTHRRKEKVSRNLATMPMVDCTPTPTPTRSLGKAMDRKSAQHHPTTPWQCHEKLAFGKTPHHGDAKETWQTLTSNSPICFLSTLPSNVQKVIWFLPQQTICSGNFGLNSAWNTTSCDAYNITDWGHYSATREQTKLRKAVGTQPSYLTGIYYLRVTHRWTNKWADRQTDRQTYEQTNGQTDKRRSI